MKNIFSFCRILLTIGLLLTVNIVFTQNTIVDSLLQLVEEDRANSEIYNQLALEYWVFDINKSKELALKALNLACKEKDSVQIAFAYNRLGTAYLFTEKIDSAQLNYSQSARIFEELKMYTELGGATACCAKIYESKFDYDNAIKEYARALKIFEKSEKSEYYTQTLIVIGGLYSKLADFQNSQKYLMMAFENISFLKDYDQIVLYNKIAINCQNLYDYQNAINFFEKAFKKCDLSNNNMALAQTYVNTGNLYIAWDKKDAALNYLEKGFELSKSSGFINNCRTILPLIADIYLSNKQFDRAIDFYSQTLAYKGESPDIFNEASAHNGLAKVYTETQQYEEAIKHSSKALSLFEEIKRPQYIANSHFILAQDYLSTNNLGKAKEHLEAATFIAQKNSFKELEAKVSLLYAKYNNIANNGLGSSAFYEKYIELESSIFAEQNQELLAKFQVGLDNLEKDYKLKEIENINKLKETELFQKKKQIAYISLISLLLLMGIVVFAVMNIRQKKANRLLFLKNKELLKKENDHNGTKKLPTIESPEIPESLQNSIISKLNEEFLGNKIHLQNDLTLHSLSKILGTNSTYLSKIIKINFDSSFSAYLNKFRIIEAQKMILDPKFSHYTIDAISGECGYNSKSTFNKAFKEITGLTPNEYKRQGTL